MLWDGTFCFSSLSEKTRKSNHLQLSLQRQHFIVSYLRPWVLVRLGFEPVTSRSADRRSPNWANQAADIWSQVCNIWEYCYENPSWGMKCLEVLFCGHETQIWLDSRLTKCFAHGSWLTRACIWLMKRPNLLYLWLSVYIDFITSASCVPDA